MRSSIDQSRLRDSRGRTQRVARPSVRPVTFRFANEKRISIVRIKAAWEMCERVRSVARGDGGAQVEGVQAAKDGRFALITHAFRPSATEQSRGNCFDNVHPAGYIYIHCCNHWQRAA